MARTQRLYLLVVIGFALWFLIFLGQIIYFSSFSIYFPCWLTLSCHSPSLQFNLNKTSHPTFSTSDKLILKRIHHQPLLQQYESQHVHFLRLIKPTTLANKYLVYTCNQPCGGWGDRTRKIVGAYLLSLVLNRTFIINMTWPCPINQFFEPNFILWNQTIKNASKRINLTVNSLAANDKDYSNVLSWQNIDVIYFKVKDLGYYSLLLWRDDFYRILHLHYGIHRSVLFLHSIFTLIYELLFKLKSHMQIYMNDISQRYDLKSLRCAHIRIGRNPSNPNDVIFPKRERMNKTVIEYLKNISKFNETIFVSTDSEQVHIYARKQFHSRLLTIDGLIRHIDRSGKKLACDGFEKAILDFYMISHCHTMIMSKSAFSYWANMRRLKPYKNLYLYCDGIKIIHSPQDYEHYPYGRC